MNIGQVETLLGMTRANIRYYEQEGLVTPQREPNGYRDYSEEDVDTLRKIKLLRQLGLSLDDIRQVQRGERTLDAALAARERQLATEQADLTLAAKLCHQMRQEQAEYPDLDAARYLDCLDRPADQPGAFDLRQDALPTAPHPWRRFFARGLDSGLYNLLWLTPWMLLFRQNPPNSNLVGQLLSSYIGYVLMFLLEPLMLSFLGTTPGKAIFGLEVRDENGAKLTYLQALSRTWKVFVQGEGYGIPFYSLYRNYKCYKICEAGEPLPWDWEERLSYTIRDTHPLRIAGFLGAHAALLALSIFAVAQFLLPPHRGAITPAEYAANVNDAARHLEVRETYYLDDTGVWMERPYNTYTIELGDGPLEHQLTVENGVVTAVHMELESRGESFYYLSTLDPQLALIAFGGARGDFNLITWLVNMAVSSDNLSSQISDNGLRSYTIETHGLRITQEVETEGYMDSSTFLLAEDGANPYLHWAFTIELI